MNKNIIYLKEASSYDDILKNEHNKMPLFLKKLIFAYKNIFNIITKKVLEDKNIWVLPIKEKYTIKKLEKLSQKRLICAENIYLISNELKNNQIEKIMDEQKQEYITEEKIKKVLLIEMLEYIATIQKKEIKMLELTILVNTTSNINMYLIEELAKIVKSLKIVSVNIYKFKKLEEKLYNEYGIAIQFSNSYNKSLEKSEIIINLDFTKIETNEYKIFDRAIIINCIKDNMNIKSRLFNGIIINSFDIELKKEFINKYKQENLYGYYKNLLLYASTIENESNIFEIREKVKIDNIIITNLIGNSGNINKKEFKNIEKSLTKIKKKSNI